MFSTPRGFLPRLRLSFAALAPVCALGTVACAPSASAASLSAPIPAELKTLEGKLSTLQLTSLRVSVSESTKVETRRLGKEAKQLAKLFSLFDFKLEGVETIQPVAASLKLRLFGRWLRVREVGGHAYLYEHKLRRRDHGRPWVRLENGPAGKLLDGKALEKPSPANAGERFAALIAKINEGRDITELGPSTLDSQPVLGFSEEVEPETTATGTGSGLFGAFSSSVGHSGNVRPSAPPKTTLEVFMSSATGMPVKVVLRSRSGKVGSIVTAEFPAINFPYTVSPPPAAEVVSERVLLKKEHQRRRGAKLPGADKAAGRESK